jgi:hypothetical protein
MDRMPRFIAAVFLLFVMVQVILGGPRIEVAFEAGVIVGAGMTVAQGPRP